jgi:hypothetical protein
VLEGKCFEVFVAMFVECLLSVLKLFRVVIGKR